MSQLLSMVLGDVVQAGGVAFVTYIFGVWDGQAAKGSPVIKTRAFSFFVALALAFLVVSAIFSAIVHFIQAVL